MATLTTVFPSPGSQGILNTCWRKWRNVLITVLLRKRSRALRSLSPGPQPAFCLWKHFSQKVSLIREARKCRNRGKQSEETKQSEFGHSAESRTFSSSSRAVGHVLSRVLWALVDTDTLHEAEEDGYMVTTLKPRHKLPHFTQFRQLASKQWEQTPEVKINRT